jgi:hypothetical protein
VERLHSRIDHLVLDVNGTLARDGQLLEGVAVGGVALEHDFKSRTHRMPQPEYPLLTIGEVAERAGVNASHKLPPVDGIDLDVRRVRRACRVQRTSAYR